MADELSPELLELKRAGNRAFVAADYAEAEQHFRALIERAPAESQGYVGLAKVWTRVHRYQEVVELLEPLVDELGSEQAIFLLADACRTLVYRGERQYLDQALLYFRQYNELRVDPLALAYEANLLIEFRKDHEQALPLREAVYEREPKNLNAYNALLACLRVLGRTERIEELKRARKQGTGKR
jgi:tetratricopeptide (TPR) repeat protein